MLFVTTRTLPPELQENISWHTKLYSFTFSSLTPSSLQHLILLLHGLLLLVATWHYTVRSRKQRLRGKVIPQKIAPLGIRQDGLGVDKTVLLALDVVIETAAVRFG